ncbi:hyaluronidase domain-containing protein [Phthorimaea operculella]|nr:hyaluronidase domain-containing protein [Phthorimaea operculella]
MIGREDREDALLKSALQADERVRVVSEHLTECLMLLEEAPNPEDKELVEGDVPLPPVTVPVFAGDYADWPAFEDLYSSVVHTRTDITPAYKMAQLMSRLHGEPHELLTHLAVSDSNYEVAWKILTDRYRNKRLIVDRLASPPAERNGRSIRAAPWGKSSDHLPTYEDLKSFLEAESRRVDVQAGEALARRPLPLATRNGRVHRREEATVGNPGGTTPHWNQGVPTAGDRPQGNGVSGVCCAADSEETGWCTPSAALHESLRRRRGSAGSDQRRSLPTKGGSNAPHPPRRSPPPHRSQGQAGDVNRRSPLTQGRGDDPHHGSRCRIGEERHRNVARTPIPGTGFNGRVSGSTRQPPGYMQYSAGLSHLVGSQDPRMPPPMPEYPRLQAQPRYGRLPSGYYRTPAMAFMGRPPTSRSGTHTQDLPEGDPVLYGSVLSEVLQRFWESEEPPTADRRKPEDDECELFYQYNTARCSSGRFVTRLPFLPNRPALGIVHIAIPRKLVPSVGCKATLHGFCDASERGYAAAVYLRTASSTGTVHVRLVMAKSKVAPVRTRWTIPKLELAGAALLARLLNHVTCNLRGTINLDETVYAWTDSRIVLCWLQTSVHTLEVFVANRVSQITGSETPLVWRHVPGEWNPADCASRGCRAPDLVSHPLWWGPQWLTESPQEWPFNECRAPLGPPDRGWIKRFVNNCRKPQAERNFTPVLSPAERNAALCSLVRVVQAEHFEEEVRLLRDGRIAIIDFESWRPIFRQNWGEIELYKEVSYKIEKRKHWFWPEKWIHVEAKERFEKAARIFMQNTISLAKQMRPHAVWGYYGFPYCFNMAGDHMTEHCAKGVEGENDQVYWLWSESTGLYPSVYSSNQLSTYQLGKMIKGRIQEAARVKRPGTPILPYFWFRYREGGFLREVDLQMALHTFNHSEASGLIIWGSSHDVNTVEKCQNLHDYIYKVFGPAIAKYTISSNRLEDEQDLMNDWLENSTTDEYFDIAATETESTTTDGTTIITDGEIYFSTMITDATFYKRETTDDPTTDSIEEDEDESMKSLLDVFLNQIFSSDNVKVNDTLVDRKNKSSTGEKVESLLRSTLYNFPETSTELTSHGISEDSGTLENRRLFHSNVTSADMSTESTSITADNWTSIITDTYIKPEEKLTPDGNSEGYSGSTETTNTESVFDSLTEILPTESNLYLEKAEDNLSKNLKKGLPMHKIGNPMHKIIVTTNNFSTESYTEKATTTIEDNNNFDPSTSKDLNSSTTTENPTISTTNVDGFEQSTTDGINSINAESQPSEASSYTDMMEIIEEPLSNDSKKGNPKTVFTTTENTMTEPYTESISQTRTDDSTTITESACLSTPVVLNLSKNLKKETESSNLDVTETEIENTQSSTEKTLQDDDDMNREKNIDIHKPTFIVTSPPESLTSGTSEQVTGSAPISRSKYIFCLIFYFSVSKCLCDYYGQC